ncbi:MAG TPA: 3-hydroxyisobutyrate dehydrogenase [Stellaceae bacterium]|jgi:3-hydroxyisobutyrate dehydrogenase|nr:3-hydroxyisobutyrate dehydrogenase [Stellaceae bacterium]
MTTIGFIGLGNMGGPMAANLLKAGHEVTGFDLSAKALEAFAAAGGKPGANFAEAAAGQDIVITMLPAGPHVRAVYFGEKGVLANACKRSLLIDCSTIDVETARLVAKEAADAGFGMLDAPVSGGVGGAAAGTLTFMVGGAPADFARAEPILQTMGKTIVHAGASGNGQAAKICNNMILGISMIGVCEGFALAEKLGLDWQRLFDISSKSSGQCWSMTNYCPVPGPVPSSPANRDYKAGFTAEMMLKDLKLAQQAAQAAGATTPMGANAAALYGLMVNAGNGAVDFSAMFRFLTARKD